MNIVRTKLQANTKVQLLDNKLHGHFNAQHDIINKEYDVHVSNLTKLWRNSIKGHDVHKPTVIHKELDLSDKLPKITARSYERAKRKKKKETAKNKIWTKVTRMWRRLSVRRLKNRGRGGGQGKYKELVEIMDLDEEVEEREEEEKAPVPLNDE